MVDGGQGAHSCTGISQRACVLCVNYSPGETQEISPPCSAVSWSLCSPLLILPDRWADELVSKTLKQSGSNKVCLGFLFMDGCRGKIVPGCHTLQLFMGLSLSIYLFLFLEYWTRFTRITPSSSLEGEGDGWVASTFLQVLGPGTACTTSAHIPQAARHIPHICKRSQRMFHLYGWAGTG